MKVLMGAFTVLLITGCTTAGFHGSMIALDAAGDAGVMEEATQENVITAIIFGILDGASALALK